MSKTIVVTGGAGGICSDICRGLATDGVNVVVADYAKEAAEKVAAEIRDNRGNAIAVQVDVGEPQSVDAMMSQAIINYSPPRLRTTSSDNAVSCPNSKLSMFTPGEVRCRELPDSKTQRRAITHTAPKLRARKARQPAPNTTARWQ